MCLRQLSNRNQQDAGNRYWIGKYEDEESNAVNDPLLFLSVFSLTSVFGANVFMKHNALPFPKKQP